MSMIGTRSNYAHKTFRRFLCLQDMRKDCTHQGDAIDPHLVCHKCQEKAKGKDGLCTEQFPCDQCRHLDSAAWAKLIRLREKREKRRQRSQEASTLRATKALSDCMRSNTSVLSVPDTPDRMPDRDPVTEKRERTKKRDESSFEKFTSPDGTRASKDDRRSSKGEKRSHSSSEDDSEQESRSGRKVIRARRRSSPTYDDRYDSRRYGPPPPPPLFDHYGRPIQYQYYPEGRFVPPQGRSRSPGNSQFTWRDASAREHRSSSRRPQRDRSASRRPRSGSPQKSSRRRESAKRAEEAEVISDTPDSDDQSRSPVRQRPNVKLTARASSSSAQRRAAKVVPDDDTGVDLLRTPTERSAPSARGDDAAAKRNLDFSDTGDASETEQGDSQEDTEFPFKDVIRLIARKSEADIKDVQTKAQKRKLTLLSDENTEEPADYAALTTAEGIVTAVDAWFEEFFDRDVKNDKGKPVRYKDMFRSKLLRPALKTYKEGDTRIRLTPLDKPKKTYSWLPTSSKRHSITDQDLQYVEELARGGLRVVSFKELVNQALNASLADKGLDAERLHRCSKEANKELLRIFTCLLGTCTQMRRDDVISRIQDTLTTSQRARLRHADVVTETELFPPELLQELDKEFQSTLTTKAMQHTLRNTGATGRGRSAGSNDTRGKSTDKKKEKSDSGTHHHRPAQGQSR